MLKKIVVLGFLCNLFISFGLAQNSATIKGRIIELSNKAADQLGIIQDGNAKRTVWVFI